MLPILISWGPIKIYSYGVCLAIGLFLALYWWWKMGRDEHFDEIALFDGYFLSLLIFVMTGRVGYVLMHYSDFGSLYRILALLAFPGINAVFGLMMALVFVILFARSHGWDGWKVADSAVVTIAIALIFANLGGLLNGSNPGIELSWGIKYIGQEATRVPLDLLMLVWSIVVFGMVSRIRKNFRFYSWYKGDSSIAQEGLSSLVFASMVGGYYLIVPWVVQNPWMMGIVPGQFVLGIMIVSVSSYLIYKRVGRRNEGIWGKLRGIIRRR